MKTLVVATMNRGKLVEIEKCLDGLDFEIKSLADFPAPPLIEEDADTFEGNAMKKAATIAEAYGYPTLSDDSGLEVDALDGAPGVHSARYGGPGLSDADRYMLLLSKTKRVPKAQRGCRFRTVMVYFRPDAPPAVFSGTMEGTLATEPKGVAGFGYDPVFIPEGMHQTVAELGSKIKNRISHRAKALAAFSQFIRGAENR